MPDPRRRRLMTLVVMVCVDPACDSDDIACRGIPRPEERLAWWYCRVCGARWKDNKPGDTHRRHTLD